jgi:hypothetical protein
MPDIHNLKAATLVGSAAFSLSVTYRGHYCQSSCLISLLNPGLLITYTGYSKAAGYKDRLPSHLFLKFYGEISDI